MYYLSKYGKNMNTSKAQLHRLIRLVGELKQNRYPNCTSFAKKLRESDIDENLNLSCSPKTIQRDIKLLKEEYDAPIEYDSEYRGYYLKHHGWDFSAPPLDDDFLVSAILGAKIAENIIPEPLKSQIRTSVDHVLASNNPDFLDTALIETFIVASGVKVTIEPEIFKTLFLGWQLRQSVEVKYCSYEETVTKRLIDPYILTYHNQVWYVKGYCHLKEDTRLFAMHRIKEAELTELTFETDIEIIKQSKNAYTPFELEKVYDIKVWCSKQIAGYVLEQHSRYGQKITENRDGSIIVYIPSALKLGMIKWVLSEGGLAKVLEPEWLWNEIVKKADDITKLY